MKKSLLLLLLLLLLVLPVVFLFRKAPNHPKPASAPLPTTAHSHNDYQHDHPLWDALHCGFNSIEVDVRLVAGIFFVAHDSADIRPFKTIRSMYLDPLRELVLNNGGSVYQDGSGIVLLVDVKSDPADGWKALKDLLAEYEEILAGFGTEDAMKGAVTLVVSGNRDLGAMVAARTTLAQYDGRLKDLLVNPDLPIITLISAKWTEEFTWTGQGNIPEHERLKLKKLVVSAHSQGRDIRFWETDFPDVLDQERIWNLLLDTGVDFICTDKLKDFRNYMAARANQ